MTSVLAEILASLTHQRGVRGSLIVSEGDGLPIDSRVRAETDVPALAALSAFLYRKARLSSCAAGLGDVTFLRLEAQAGLVCIAGRDDLLLIVLAEPGANVGRIRVDMLKSVAALA